ncbi:MAG TPA: MFS transporter [Vicinamibacterales bacterium]|nr:MFS transporter [Vicinamibacterales bacterium]
MPSRQLAALILASALITLDGTATNIALPAIGRDLSASMPRLQWIANAPLLALAAMLLPAGTAADRFGHVRLVRIGLMLFVAASVACALAWSDAAIIGAKLGQGAGGALVLPATLAVLRSAYGDAAERTRVLGIWAAWTGAAGAAGPLLAGVLVDVLSWRAVFIPPIVAGAAAVMLLKRESAGRARGSSPVPGFATAALMVVLGAFAYLVMHASRSGLNDGLLLIPAALAVAAGVALSRDPQRQVLFPRELVTSRNCLPANGITFALYFGMFGLSFLLALYVQQVLHYSAMWAAVVLLPMSIMLLFAERFGRLTASVGTRWVVLGGALLAAGSLAWIGSAPHPVPFWSHIILGTACLGLGISAAVSALTHAAVAAVPETCAGAASGLNHAVVRAAGLIAVALLGSIAAPGASDVISADGFRRAVLMCAAVVAAGGIAGSVRLRDDKPGGVEA